MEGRKVGRDTFQRHLRMIRALPETPDLYLLDHDGRPVGTARRLVGDRWGLWNENGVRLTRATWGSPSAVAVAADALGVGR